MTSLVPKDIEEISFNCAQEALSAQEVPVGCVMVFAQVLMAEEESKKVKSEFVVKGRNRVNERKNATRHAEFECIDQLVEYFKTRGIPLTRDTWSRVTVYVTVEPCIMCTRALRSLGVKEVYFGCQNLRFGGCGSVYDFHVDPKIEDPPLICHPKTLNEERAIRLLQGFYECENPNAPADKKKKKRPKTTLDHDTTDNGQSEAST